MENFKPEKFFVYISLIIGILLVFIIPPMQSPDENSHFKRAYTVSKFRLYPSVQNNKRGFIIENDILDFVDKYQKIETNLQSKFNFSNLYFDQFLERKYIGESFVSFSTVDITPVAYIIPGLGIIFSKIVSKIIYGISAPALFMLLFARLFCLLAYILICYMAIKKTPKFKKSMCFVATLPMCLFLSSAISYDSLLISLSLLFISLTLNLVYNDNIKEFDLKYILIFSIIGFVFLNIKVVYITLFSLLFLIPKNKFKKEKKIRYVIILLLIIIFLTILNKIPSFINNIEATQDTMIMKQMSWSINHPFKSAFVVLSNIKDQFWYQWTSIIGKFGLLDTNLPGMLTFVISLFLVLVFFADACSEKIKIKKSFKLILFLSILVSIILIYSVFYLQWTPKKYNSYGSSIRSISGVQGRYFIPLLFPIVLLISNNMLIKNKVIKKLCNIISNNYQIMIITSLVTSFTVILLRFWV